MKPAFKLEAAEARAMVQAALAKAKEIGVAETACVVDEGGYPIVLERMDGARITGPKISSRAMRICCVTSVNTVGAT